VAGDGEASARFECSNNKTIMAGDTDKLERMVDNRCTTVHEVVEAVIADETVARRGFG
jgi:hypothetical protein